MSTLTIYVGHDPREQLAYDVCVHSLKKRTDANIVKLSTSLIPEYKRPKGEHESTDFTYSRFFVPYLNGFKGFAMFVDCDYVFLDDPAKLLKTDEYWRSPVSVCKHPQYVPNSYIKMDGIHQHTMPMKNWASLMLFNCAHPDLKILTPQYVNTVMPGRSLHQFEWIKEKESIGSIPLDWNCLDGYYHLANPKAIHYTDGGPWFKDYQHTFYSQYWYAEYTDMLLNDTSRSVQTVHGNQESLLD
jgi:hypothetical protein